ncbi:Uncharacterized protein Fot_19476 [Forsythia ovata]|uniref:Uncharacterized protein n=1 Tax=Forsythia ovata TaxID=205694 RepID=A0ABD1VNX4_9LAMI
MSAQQHYLEQMSVVKACMMATIQSHRAIINMVHVANKVNAKMEVVHKLKEDAEIAYKIFEEREARRDKAEKAWVEKMATLQTILQGEELCQLVKKEKSEVITNSQKLEEEFKSERARSEEVVKSLADEKVRANGKVAQCKASSTFEAMQQVMYCDILDEVVAFIEENRLELDIEFLHEAVREEYSLTDQSSVPAATEPIDQTSFIDGADLAQGLSYFNSQGCSWYCKFSSSRIPLLGIAGLFVLESSTSAMNEGFYLGFYHASSKRVILLNTSYLVGDAFYSFVRGSEV